MTFRRSISCGHCGYHISPIAGTIFEKSKTPLLVWFQAIHLILQSDAKVPAYEIQRQFKLTYKTAWRMKYLICKYLAIESSKYNYAFSSKTNGRFYQLAKNTQNVL